MLALSDLWTYVADVECGSCSPLYQRISHAVAASDDVLDQGTVDAELLAFV